jgi:hypothetical protein
MWALILTIVVNVQQFPMMSLTDGSGVYMRTTTFRVAVGPAGGWATKAECQAYQLPPNPEFVYTYMDTAGNPQSVVFQNIPISVVGCSKVF